ncbi:site-2 protease family protein [Aerosakkonema sp. BLCC-F183]
MNEYERLICPDIRAYWKLAAIKGSDRVILLSAQGNNHFQFSAAEGYALRYFTGEFTALEIQNHLNREFQPTISANLVVELLQKLITLGILADEVEDEERGREAEREKQINEAFVHSYSYSKSTSVNQTSPTPPLSPSPTPNSPHLKPCVHWVAHPDGYWILRNPEDITFLQVGDRDKAIISQLGQLPTHLIAEEYCITQTELKYLLQLLAATGMLSGTKPAKPRPRKFTPLQLLSFKIRLFNPDKFLSRHIDKLRFLWTHPTAFLLSIFLLISAVIGFNQQPEIIFIGQQLLANYGSNLLLPFVLLTALVVTLHELGHAFTLKHFGGIVPEIGLLFMCFIPSAYTNTSDSYCLSRFQRILVIGAGILVQLIIAATALWLWNLSTSGTWLSTTSFLLMSAALFTVALNLNPLAKFDGYYLAVAITGINNLRSRAKNFYANLLTGKPIRENWKNACILAAYGPFSIAYIWCVFGFLLLHIAEWNLTNIPITAGVLLFVWAIYFLLPTSENNLNRKN